MLFMCIVVYTTTTVVQISTDAAQASSANRGEIGLLPLGRLTLAELLLRFLEVLDNRLAHHLRHIQTVGVLPL
jgi:hypothetical protein